MRRMFVLVLSAMAVFAASAGAVVTAGAQAGGWQIPGASTEVAVYADGVTYHHGIRRPRPCLELAMAETPPIACTLSSAELKDREGAWKKLLGSGLVERDLVPGGIRLRPAPGAATALMNLIDLERECCAWIRFDINERSVVTLTAEGDGEAVLAGMFRSAEL
jgi:hypothetical protein